MATTEGHTNERGDLVVAIDFGTSRSSVAYTVVGVEDNSVKVTQLSGSASHVKGDLKTSTSVLLLDDGKVHAFGFKAEELFAEDEERSWALYKCFKMNLHNHPESDPLVESFGGDAREKLSDILRKCLEYVKADALKQLEDAGHSTSPENLFWVLTVPAIWDDHAKDMMRSAAFKAGLIDSKQSSRLLLALEPECAAIACQTDEIQKGVFDVGTRFLLADCGGGTLDITLHEVVQASPLKLKELARPEGGASGSTNVDEEFFKFFRTLVGRERFETFQSEEPAEYLALFKEWEEKKVSFTFDWDEKKCTTLKCVRDAVEAMGIKRDFSWMVEAWNEGNPTRLVKPPDHKLALRLSFELMVSFFEGTVQGIVDQIRGAAFCRGLGYVVMAGGFAKCKLLQERLRKEFEGTSVKVILPSDPDLLIVKGAALFGARPTKVVMSRKSRYTFGIRSTLDYDETNELHRRYEDKVYRVNGRPKLRYFDIHGRVGADLDQTGQKKVEYVPSDPEQRYVELEVLATDKPDVFHVSEDGVKPLAKIVAEFDMSLPFLDRRVWVLFSFGGTEVRCAVFDASGEKEIEAVAIEFYK